MKCFVSFKAICSIFNWFRNIRNWIRDIPKYQLTRCDVISHWLSPHHTIPFIIIRSPHFYFLWVGVGGFSKVVATFNHVGGFFNLFMATTGDVWLTPSFRIVLHVEHISCVITNCGQHQWVTPSPLSIVLQALLEENTTRELSLSLDFLSKLCYSRWLSLYSFLSLSFLLTFFRLVCYCSMWLYFSQETIEVFRIIVNWCRVAVSNDKSIWWVPSLFCVSFLTYFFFKLIVAAYCVLSMWGKKWFQCIGYDYMACMDYMDPDVPCLQNAVKFNHSLTQYFLGSMVIQVMGCSDLAEWSSTWCQRWSPGWHFLFYVCQEAWRWELTVIQAGVRSHSTCWAI